MADAAFARLVRGLMDEEVTPTLTVPPGADLAGYKRLAPRPLRQSGAQAPHLADRHGRLAEAAAAPARHRSASALPQARRSSGWRSAVAAWMRYAAGVDEGGKPIDVRDPLAERLGRIGRESRPRRRASRAGLSRHPRDLRRRPAGRPALRRAGDSRPRQPHPGRRQENSRNEYRRQTEGLSRNPPHPEVRASASLEGCSRRALRWASCVLRGLACGEHLSMRRAIAPLLSGSKVALGAHSGRFCSRAVASMTPRSSARPLRRPMAG